MLPDASKFVVDIVEIFTEMEKLKFEIHGVHSDACILDTCCVTNEQEEVTCFAMNADFLTMLCTVRDVKQTTETR